MSVLTTDRVSVRGPAHFIQNDTRTQVVWFTVNRYRDGIDLAGLSWSIHILNSAGIPDVAVPFEQPDVRGDKIIIGWLVRGTATAAAGDLTFNLRGVGEDENGNALRWSGGDEKRPVYTAQESEPSDEQEAALSELDALIEYVGDQLPGVISAGKEARAAANAANASAEAASNAGTAAASAANAAIEATANAKNLPYIGENGNWYLWDTKTGAYVDSGKPSRGEGSEGGGGITEETDPTVPNWAKAPNKPSYTAAEVGALPATYVPPDQTAAQVGADPAGTASKAVSTHNTSGAAHNDIRLELSALAARINAALNSDDVNLDQMAEIVAYIKSNKSLIDAITTGKVSVSDIVNNLTTNAANKPLSAAQGVALKRLIDAITVPTKLSQLAEDATHRLVTDTEKSGWSAKLDASALPEAINTALAQAKASGEFDGTPGDPGYTPVKGKDYFDGEDGVSPTVAVSDITGGHRIAITDKNGTKTVDVMDGEKGDAGRGITSIARTSGNSAAGTVDTYTITYTDGSKSAFAVSNGKDGTTYTPSIDASGNLSWTNNGGLSNPATVNIKGPKGSDAAVTAANIQTALGYVPADTANVVQRQQGSANIGKILMVGSDGNLILTDMPVAGGDVTGVVDDSNNIILSGDLADGTYTLKYLKTDGTYIDAGELVVSSIATYAIICNLTNCTSSGADTIRQGGTATITVAANDGYNLPDSITVSGAEYTWDKTGGQIALSNPTSDVTITVAAVAAPTYTNLADQTSTDWLKNTRIKSDGSTTAQEGVDYSNFMPISDSVSAVHIKGLDIISPIASGSKYGRVRTFDANKEGKAIINPNSYLQYFSTADYDDSVCIIDWSAIIGGISTAKGSSYIRLCGIPTAEEIIVTTDEPIA